MDTKKKQGAFLQDMAIPVAVLLVICLLAAALLGIVNAMTKPVIEENKIASAIRTRKEVLPEAEDFEELPVSEALAAKGVTGIFRGNGGTGYVVTAVNKGYGGDVVVTVGFDAAGRIRKVAADVSTETVGVGSKVGEEKVLERFSGLEGDAGGVELVAQATYTSVAVRNGVQAAMDAVASVL